MDGSSTDGGPTKEFQPPRYRSATRLNIRELGVMAAFALGMLLFLALVWVIPAVEGWTIGYILMAIGIDVAIVLFMWGIFAFGIKLATKRPRRGIERVSRDDLRGRLMSLNDEDSPFVLVEVAPYHLVGRWKLEVPAYYTLFGKHGLSEVYQLDLYLHPGGSVAALETRGSINWDVTTVPPRARYSWSYVRGIVLFSYKLHREWAMDWNLRFRKVVDFTFDVQEYKRPVVNVIVGSGWTFRPILFRPLRWKGE